MEWRIGCSGFYYKEWKEIFYPMGLPQKQWFEYYCKHFNTIEINSSFYGLPSLKSFAAWHDSSPEDFLFSIKAPRTITHYKKFNGARQELHDFYKVTRDGLKEKLGCVLFQMPPSFSYTAERLDLLLNSMEKGFNNVIEARHISWWNENVYATLKSHGITFSGISYPSGLPDKIIHGTDIIYYRFHGKPVLYKSEYFVSELKDFTNSINDTRQVYVYFNNTWGGAALTNSKQLIKLVEKK